jgi:hypothetical protein
MKGHLLSGRCACFAKQAERNVDSAKRWRSVLSGAHVPTSYAPLLRQASGTEHWQRRKTAQCAFRCSRRLAYGAFLNRLQPELIRSVVNHLD